MIKNEKNSRTNLNNTHTKNTYETKYKKIIYKYTSADKHNINDLYFLTLALQHKCCLPGRLTL